MGKAKLPPRWIVTLLGQIGGMNYSIVGPGGQFGSQWSVCLYCPLGLFDCSEHVIGSGPTVYAAMQDAFPVLREKDWRNHPVWVPNNWRKGKYVG